VVKNYLMCRDSIVVWYSCIKDSTLCGDCVGKIVENLPKCGKSAKMWNFGMQYYQYVKLFEEVRKLRVTV